MSDDPNVWTQLMNDRATRRGLLFGLLLPGLPIAFFVLMWLLSLGG